MKRCRSSAGAGCDREAGQGTFGAFCEQHAAELAAIRSRCFTPSGAVAARPSANTAASAIETDARAVAVEVLRTGRSTKRALSAKFDFGGAQVDRALLFAERKGWVLRTRRGVEPGESYPDGKLPRDCRAAMLGRYVREAGTVPASEAAAAIGLQREGSFARVVAYARAEGLVRTTAGRGGGIAPA